MVKKKQSKSQKIIAMIKAGHTNDEIAKTLKVKKQQIYNARYRIKKADQPVVRAKTVVAPQKTSMFKRIINFILGR